MKTKIIILTLVLVIIFSGLSLAHQDYNKEDLTQQQKLMLEYLIRENEIEQQKQIAFEYFMMQQMLENFDEHKSHEPKSKVYFWFHIFLGNN